MYKPGCSFYPKQFRQIIDHGESICLQFDDIGCRLARVDGEMFISERSPYNSYTLTDRPHQMERIAIRIPKDMLHEIREALDGI
jgi:hypothetical protein